MGGCGVRGEGAAAPSPRDAVSLAFGLASRLWDPQQVPAGRMESKGTVHTGSDLGSGMAEDPGGDI